MIPGPLYMDPEYILPENLVVKDKYSSDIHMDLYSKFLQERIIFCHGPIMPPMSAQIVPQLYWLSKQDPKKKIEVWVNGPGGSVSEGLAIIDMMRMVKAPVHTVVQGYAASMSAMIALMGNKRSALSHAEIMLHQVSFGTQGTVQTNRTRTTQAERQHRTLMKMIAEYTHLGSLEEVTAFLENQNIDRWFSPDDAKEKGIIDSIIPSNS